MWNKQIATKVCYQSIIRNYQEFTTSRESKAKLVSFASKNLIILYKVSFIYKSDAVKFYPSILEWIKQSFLSLYVVVLNPFYFIYSV